MSAPLNNAVLVHNFLNQTLNLDQTVVDGQIVGRVTESDPALAGAGQYAWEGRWTGDLLIPVAFARLTVNGEERLTFATPDGLVCWFHDGWDDAGAEISDELLTRGYFGSREVLALKGALQLETFNPSITASIKTAGVNEEETLEGFNPLTRDRTQYLIDGQDDYDPATSTEAEFDAPYREDYSPTAEELTVSTEDTHQTITEPFRCRERDYGIQLRLANAQGSCRIAGTVIQAKPVGISATRKA